MKIKVVTDSAFSVDGVSKAIKDLDQAFLDNLVDLFLNDEVELEIEGNSPLSNFFQTLQQETNAESELRRIKEEISQPENNDGSVDTELEKGEQSLENITLQEEDSQ